MSTGKKVVFPLLATLAGALAAIPDVIAPWVPRDSMSHAFGIGYAWKIITGKASAALCKFWYMGFPYTGTYGFIPYILASPLYPLLGGYKSFGVAMTIAASLFTLSTYLLCRSFGISRLNSTYISMMTSSGMIAQWVRGGIYPMTLSMAFGNISNAYYNRNTMVSVLFLTLSLHSHPAGGALSVLTMTIRGIYKRDIKFIPIVVSSTLISLPFYVRFIKLYPVMSSLVNMPHNLLSILKTSIFSPGLPILTLGLIGAILLIRRKSDKMFKEISIITLTIFSISWITAFILITHPNHPPARNLLVDRLTCVWCTPFLSSTAIVLVSNVSPIVNTLLLPAVYFYSIYTSISNIRLSYPKGPWIYVVKSWWYMYNHYNSKYYNICSGPVIRYLKPPVDCPGFQPLICRPTGYFSQGCPYFNALIARLEWERGAWWYVPYSQRTIMMLTGSKYALVFSPHVKKLMKLDEINRIKTIGCVGIFECKSASLIYKINPIALYCPYNNTHKVLTAYTTFLNLIPKSGYKYMFVLCNNKTSLNRFSKIIIVPKSKDDVIEAIKLSDHGKRVILIIPSKNKHVQDIISKVLNINIHKGFIKFHPVYVTNVLNFDYRLIGLGRVRSMKAVTKVAVHYVDGRLVKTFKRGRGLLKVVGIDPIKLVEDLHPVPIIEGPNHLAVPLPGKFERRIVSDVLKGFEDEVKTVSFHGNRECIIVNKKGWYLIATRFTPEWIVYGGKKYVGSGGDLVVKVSRKKALLVYNPYIPWWSLFGPVAGITLLVLRRFFR